MITIVVVFFALLAVGQSKTQLQRRITKNDTIILGERSNITWEESTLDHRDSTALIRRWPGKTTSASHPITEPISVPLFQHGSSWVATMSMGESGEKVSVEIETTSLCLAADKRGSKSARRVLMPHTWKMACPWSGHLYQDKISFGGITWEKAKFIDPGNIIGVVGLSKSGPFVTEFIQKLVNPPIFALHLAETGSRLHLGGPVGAYHTGKIDYGKVKGAWEPDATIFVGDKVVVSSIPVVFDTSIDHVTGYADDVTKLHSLTKDLNRPCDHVFIKLKSDGNQKWKLLGDGEKPCKSVSDAMASDQYRILYVGREFMKRMYLVFDATPGNSRMGIAERPKVPPSG